MKPSAPSRGRGSRSNPDNRFAAWQRSAFDDGWDDQDDLDSPKTVPTKLIIDRSRTVISRNQSPDVPFSQSINPYKGCEHGCAYCFARPSHAYLGLSPGLDFETTIAWKPDAADCLRRELASPSYRCQPIALGINTDAWQPIERQLGLTRQLLAILAETRHPVSIVTKSALIERDVDLLADLAKGGLVKVMFSITTLDRDLARRLEPRAASPARRLAAMAELHRAGVPVGVLFAPLIPAVNDHEMERVLEAAYTAGAESAGYVLLRLPREVKALFEDWLQTHLPDRAQHVLSLLRQLRGGALNDSRFGHRMRGEGVFADLYRQRLHRCCQRLGLNRSHRELITAAFRAPCDDQQLALF